MGALKRRREATRASPAGRRGRRCGGADPHGDVFPGSDGGIANPSGCGVTSSPDLASVGGLKGRGRRRAAQLSAPRRKGGPSLSLAVARPRGRCLSRGAAPRPIGRPHGTPVLALRWPTCLIRPWECPGRPPAFFQPVLRCPLSARNKWKEPCGQRTCLAAGSREGRGRLPAPLPSSTSWPNQWQSFPREGVRARAPIARGAPPKESCQLPHALSPLSSVS